MKKEDITYGIQLGYKMGRLEFIWGSPLEEAMARLDEMKEEVVELLKQKGCVPKGDNVNQFINSVLAYFSDNNMDILAMVLVGVGALRLSTAMSVSDENPHKTELTELAKNGFEKIPDYLVKNANELYEKLYVKKVDSVWEIVAIVDEHINGGGQKENNIDDLFF